MATEVHTETPSAAVRPEFLRFPKNGQRDPHTGLTRGFLYALATEGRIQTISLRARGAKRGVSLIVFDSLMEYIRSAGGKEAA